LANTQPWRLTCVSAYAGGWLLASAHIVTAIIGAGVLGLPHAMSWLGWVGGVIVLVLFFWITLWSSLLLADMYEVDGVKHPTYRSAVLHILGERHPLAAWQGGGVGQPAATVCAGTAGSSIRPVEALPLADVMVWVNWVPCSLGS
jgi:hypothetical protein